MFMSDFEWKHVSLPIINPAFCIGNCEFAGIVAKMNLAEGSLMDGFPDVFFYHLHCTILLSC